MSIEVANYRTGKTGDGYTVERTDDGQFFYVWHEAGWPADPALTNHGTVSAALRAAADDWDENGSVEPKHASVLRAAATRLDKKGAFR